MQQLLSCNFLSSLKVVFDFLVTPTERMTTQRKQFNSFKALKLNGSAEPEL